MNMENQVSEPVEVIAYFHNRQIEIMRFKWNNTVYNVSGVNSSWKIPCSGHYEYHFSLTCRKQKVICELAYNLSDFKWQLIQYENLE